MKFTVAAIAALAAVARAQDPASVEKFFSDLGNYYSSLQANPDFISVAGGLLTQSPEIVASLQALQTNTDVGMLTAPPAVITALPSPYNSLFLSVFSDQQSLASKDGILSDGKLVGSAGAAISSAVASATSAAGSMASDMSTAMTGSMASDMSTMSMASDSMASDMSTMSTGASGSAAQASMTSSSSGGAPAPTGMVAMGGVAALIGGVAALL